MIRLSLKAKLSLSVGFIILLVLGISTLIHIRALRQDYLQAIEWRSEALAQEIFYKIQLIKRYNVHFREEFQRYFQEFPQIVSQRLSPPCQEVYDLNKDKNITHVGIIRKDGVIMAHNDEQALFGTLEDPFLLTSLQERRLITARGEKEYHTFVPIFDDQDVFLGAIDIGVPKGLVDGKIWGIISKALWIFGISVIFAFFTISQLMSLLVVTPIKNLIGTMNEVEHGNLDVKAEIASNDEIGELAEEFNAMEEQLQESFQKRERLLYELLELKKAVETMPLGVTITDVNRKIIYTNPADAKMHGYGVGELLGQDVRTFAPPDLKRIVTLEQIKGWSGAIRESVNLRKDGSSFPVRLLSEIVQDDTGDPIAIVTTCEDITERKQLEHEREQLESQLRQAQKLEALGLLAGGIAHDFNNILGMILGYTELMLDEFEDGSQEQTYLQHVYKAGERGKDLILQILTFSRTREQKLAVMPLVPIVKETLKMIRAITPANIEIQQHIQQECPPILADSAQIHQILVNLCVNANHAMSGRGGTLEVGLNTITCSPSQATLLGVPEGDYLQLTVQDTGHGIAPEIQERIFEPFFTTKDIGEGSGLGLSVVHGIVKGHHGAITVESEPGKGTRFTIVFPVTKLAPSVQSEEIQERRSKTSHEHLLLVDDEPTLVELYRLALQKLGYHVTVSQNGENALELFKKHPEEFDLVFTDQAMPRMTGMQLSKEILHIRPDIPIILTTGYNENVTEQQAKDLGIRQFLMKPIKDPDTDSHYSEDIGTIVR